MVKVRTAKVKGSMFEYDIQHSLKALYPDIYRTSERGYQLQYDLHTDQGMAVIECKRLKGISWNQLDKFYQKLMSDLRQSLEQGKLSQFIDKSVIATGHGTPSSKLFYYTITLFIK